MTDFLMGFVLGGVLSFSAYIVTLVGDTLHVGKKTEKECKK